MGRIIEVDIKRLENESNNMKEMIDDIDREVAGMVEAINELSTMWKGPANSNFMAQFLSDREVFEKVSKEVRECIDNMLDAVKLYRKCEDDVNGIVSAIKID